MTDIERPRVKDNDRDEITVTLGGKEIRGWSYENEAERREKIGKAREFVEGWLECDRVNPKAKLIAALEEARRAIGDHSAPHDCYATGPLTGDDYRDLVECPACSFITKHDAALSQESL